MEGSADALGVITQRVAQFGTTSIVATTVTATAAAVARHHWTIPVAYDRDGTVQQLYDVVACPMVEMADRGGIVRSRLIGDRWQSVPALTPYVRGLVTPGPVPPA